jgi:3-deoxy-D-manno-octulosonate 8-phosphate phosphatase (KDO 8-P phosphatase)
MTPDLQERLKKIRLFLTDVDGVLTDGGITVTEHGESKRFHVLDGLGQRLLQLEGLRVGWISNRASVVTERRATELKVDFLAQGKTGKVSVAKDILTQTGLSFDEVAYAGDDLVDVGLLRLAGVAFTVPDARPEAMAEADYVTTARGGHGAVREMVELILKAQGKWEAIVARYQTES